MMSKSYYKPKYKEKVYCGHCTKNYEKSDCPLYTTKSSSPVIYPVCPECVGNYRIRTSPKLKEWVKRRRKEKAVILRPSFYTAGAAVPLQTL